MTNQTGNEGQTTSHSAVDDPLEALRFLKGEAEKLWAEWSDKHKRANILIAGKTGVGKSTLINAVFRDNLAETGIGRPVTQGVEEVTQPGSVLCILDTKGLELKSFETIRASILEAVEKRRNDPDSNVHLAWVCIMETGGRIEDGDVQIVRDLKGLGLSVIVVVTKATTFRNNPFEAELRKVLGDLADGLVLTRGIAEPQYDDDDNVIGTRAVKGIDELIDLSYRFIPASQRQCFANALATKNRSGLETKRKEAEAAVAVAATAAGVVGATPIPFADAVALVPIQGAMIAKISQIYGMEVNADAVVPIVSALVGVSGATLVGRTVVSSLLKFVPGVGSVAGGVIAATTATMLTKGVGQLYITTLEKLAENNELNWQAAVAKMRSGFKS